MCCMIAKKKVKNDVGSYNLKDPSNNLQLLVLADTSQVFIHVNE